MEEFLMSRKEVDKYRLLEAHKQGKITLKEVSGYIGLSYRQTKRIWHKYKTQGAKGLISQKRSKASNRKIPKKIEEEVVKVIRKFYLDFPPTHVTEKLNENHGLILSKETVRQFMIRDNLWFPKDRKLKLHRRRPRRERIGELELMDASDEAWFEERGPRCSLHLIIDDATSNLMGGHFTVEECTDGYMNACREYFKKRGIPRSIYVDKRGTFKVNKGANNEQKETQFGRVMRELGVQMIYAHSPQAKGRIERAFGTLQNRLIREMRLHKINTIEEANQFLPIYIEEHNRKFGQTPISSFDAHRSLDHKEDLNYIFCHKEHRIVNKELEISYKSKTYQIDPFENKQLVHQQIDIITTLEGELVLEYKGKRLNYMLYNDITYKQPILEFTEIRLRKKTPVSIIHPWKRWNPDYLKTRAI